MRTLRPLPRLWFGAWAGLAASIVAGALFGAFLLYVGFQHNPQGEFFDESSGALDLPYTAMHFSASLLVVALPLSLVLCALPLAVRAVLLRMWSRRAHQTGVTS